MRTTGGRVALEGVGRLTRRTEPNGPLRTVLLLRHPGDRPGLSKKGHCEKVCCGTGGQCGRARNGRGDGVRGQHHLGRQRRRREIRERRRAVLDDAPRCRHDVRHDHPALGRDVRDGVRRERSQLRRTVIGCGESCRRRGDPRRVPAPLGRAFQSRERGEVRNVGVLPGQVVPLCEGIRRDERVQHLALREPSIRAGQERLSSRLRRLPGRSLRRPQGRRLEHLHLGPPASRRVATRCRRTDATPAQPIPSTGWRSSAAGTARAVARRR